MAKTLRILLGILLLLVVIIGLWAYFKTENPTTAPIAQIHTGQPTSGEDTGPTRLEQQEATIPGMVVASVTDTAPVEFVPNRSATTYKLGQGTTLRRTGKKIAGSHTGILPVKQGVVQVVKGNIVGGALVFALDGLLTTDDAGSGLDVVLKGPDFFAVDEYPTGSFIIEKVAGGTVTGVLTLKGVAKKISFPAVVIVEDDSVLVTAQFAFNRKEWNISGGGPVVHDYIELDFTLRFTP